MINANGEKFVGEWQDGQFVEMTSGGSNPDRKSHPAAEDEAKTAAKTAAVRR